MARNGTIRYEISAAPSGSLVSALAKGGTDAVSYPAALAWGAAYVVIGLLAAGLVFSRRDVTD